MPKLLKTVTKACVEASDLSTEAESDVIDLTGGYGHDDIPFNLDWESEDDYPDLKKFLVDTFGPKAKEHDEWLLECC